MNRIPFVQVEMIIDKLYDFSLPEEKVQDRIELIQETIEACGWDIDDYIHVMMFPENSKVLN